MNKNTFYLTTAIPYVNGKPHIGHALEYFQADTIRNYHKLLGFDTLLLSGADENGLKNIQAAEKEGIPIQDFLDKNSLIFKTSYEKLGIHLDIFERGSNKNHHFPGVSKLWSLCLEKGDIYKKSYSGLYCIGCESFKTEKELINGKCQDHQTIPEKIKEDNYFFKLTNYQNTLLKLIESDTLRIIPSVRKNEIVSFIKNGLEDFSISRSKKRAQNIGVPVPNDPDQVMYVWFDALAIYITGIGYGIDEKEFKKWWPANLHVIGKDINRFHTVYWPAMLLSAGLEIPKSILIHGFVQSGGQKMSKTLGNVIDPFEMTEKYGLEPFRYYMLSQIPTYSDGDFTENRFREVYNSDLANGLGNLVARVARLAEKNNKKGGTIPSSFDKEITHFLDTYELNLGIEYIWDIIGSTDKFINEKKPWEQKDEELTKTLDTLIQKILHIGFNLKPFLPNTANQILEQFGSDTIKSSEPLFPRIT